MVRRKLGRTLGAGCLALATAGVFAGCDRKEKVIDIETPHGQVEVDRDKDSGKVNVEVTMD
ncbi:MAG: hypothetical protein JJ992_02485, partial [Planctomycetes bacterium]|nr:hypothetical protein [Planctomycetota bacterium]